MQSVNCGSNPIDYLIVFFIFVEDKLYLNIVC